LIHKKYSNFKNVVINFPQHYEYVTKNVVRAISKKTREQKIKEQKK
jgi:hypothetical protein